MLLQVRLVGCSLVLILLKRNRTRYLKKRLKPKRQSDVGLPSWWYYVASWLEAFVGEGV